MMMIINDGDDSYTLISNPLLPAVTLVVNDLVQLYVESLLQFVAESLETTPHVGLYSRWATELVTRHGQVLKTRAPQIMSTLNALQKSLSNHHTNLSKVYVG